MVGHSHTSYILVGTVGKLKNANYQCYLLYVMIAKLWGFPALVMKTKSGAQVTTPMD